jgi:hypothetical protein
MLTVSQLSKSFAGRALFDDVSPQINRGESNWIGWPQWWRITVLAKTKVNPVHWFSLD